MGKVIAVTNQKGGVGKTTTSVNLAACLGKLGRKVLLIDLDPQANTTMAVGIEQEDFDLSIYEVILQDCNAIEACIPTKYQGLTLLPSSTNLAAVDLRLAQLEDGREKMLSKAIAPLKEHFDYIIIDCPPSLGILNTNALTAADSVIIPVQSEFFALQGLTQLLISIRMIQKNFNKNLKIEGVLLTMYDIRSTLNTEVAIEVTKYFQDKVYNTRIRRNVALSEAASNGMPIYEYSKRSNGAQDYTELAKEVDKGYGKDK
jgi:chromosome partitioning protein